MRWKLSLGIVSLFLLGGIIWYDYQDRFSPDEWTAKIPKVGFSSSIRAIDLNLDGTLDLVVGGGGEEFQHTANGITAIDGRNGQLLWKVGARNQIVGSAIFNDITMDGIPDVFIGGRSAILMAIDGSNGEIIWEFLRDSDSLDLVNDTTILNFFNPQFIADIDGDGQSDLLISFGGFVRAKPEELDRPAGSLMIISSQNGALLKQMLMPDGAETYMSPIVQHVSTGQTSVIFGSGGEKINGHLYKISLSDLLTENPASAKVLASGEGKGFIAPPILADVNFDKVLDIIANPVNGNMICIDGKTDQIIWQINVDPDYEVYVSPVPGFFSQNDSIPDFFSSLGAGPWPKTKFTWHILVDGQTGDIVFSDTLGLFQYASPVVFDLDEDGKDDIFLAINDRRILPEISANAKFYVNELKILDLEQGTFRQFGPTKLGSNLGATPLLVDLDGDQWLDIIYCYMADANDFYSFKNGVIERYEIKVIIEHDVPWGTYMGQNYDGIFQ